MHVLPQTTKTMQVNDSGATSGLSVLSQPWRPSIWTSLNLRTNHANKTLYNVFLNAVQNLEFFFSRNQELANRP
jgi:hypothetical protein